MAPAGTITGPSSSSAAKLRYAYDEDVALKRRKPKRKKKKGLLMNRYVAQPSPHLGIWVVEAGPADGNWASIASVIIFSATENASQYMVGHDVDLTGFALHPNPSDAFHAGSLKDYPDAPEEAKQSGGMVGARWRPFGGRDDNGELVWIAGLNVARTCDCMCFVCVDVGVHGPIREDTLRSLEGLGVLDKYNNNNLDPRTESLHSPQLCAQRLQECDEVRAMARDHPTLVGRAPTLQDLRKHAEHHHHIIEDEPKTDLLFVEEVAPPKGRDHFCSPQPPIVYDENKNVVRMDDDDDFDCITIDSTADNSSICSAIKHDPADPIEELRQGLDDMDLDKEQVWATLVTGSRIL